MCSLRPIAKRPLLLLLLLLLPFLARAAEEEEADDEDGVDLSELNDHSAISSLSCSLLCAL